MIWVVIQLSIIFPHFGHLPIWSHASPTHQPALSYHATATSWRERRLAHYFYRMYKASQSHRFVRGPQAVTRSEGSATFPHSALPYSRPHRHVQLANVPVMNCGDGPTVDPTQRAQPQLSSWIGAKDICGIVRILTCITLLNTYSVASVAHLRFTSESDVKTCVQVSLHFCDLKSYFFCR